MNPVAKKVAKFGLPLLVLALAAGVVAALIMTKAEPERKDKSEQRVLVSTATVDESAHRLDVEAAGEVIAARDLVVTPQVAGRIEWVHDKLVPGGVVREGETLFRIEPDNYRIAVEEAQTQLAQAQAQLEQEKGRVEVAQREWDLFKDEVKGDEAGGKALSDPSLALRGPQLESAQVSVDAARARLERAQLDLQRTSVKAPFDAFVQSESADVGQIVGSQSQVAKLVGTEAFWVRISVPVEKVTHINIPNVNADTGSTATVLQEVGTQPIEREGRVVRLLGDLDPQGRMARVLIQIDDPFGLGSLEEVSEPSKRGIPLLLSSYVNVSVQGPEVDGLIEVPREAIRDADKAYVFSDEQTLEVREVNVVWKRPDTVLIDAGLSGGDKVIVSPLATAVEGMKLRDQDSPKVGADKKASDEQEASDE